MWAISLEEMETYISSHQNTVAQYIATPPILDLFLDDDWRPISRVPKRWWDQKGLDFEGLREASVVEGYWYGDG